MTVTPRGRPLSFSSIEDVAEALRGQGGRLTTPRRLVLQALFATGDLVTAERIAAGTDTGVALDLSSVYRNLEKLEELGVVQHIQTIAQMPAEIRFGERLQCEVRDHDQE